MPASYSVTTGRNQKMTFSGEGDQVKITWHQDYYVEVSGVAASSVSPYDVLTATGIPVVNRSVYYDGSKIIPFVVCRSKTAQQNPKRLSRWTVNTQWGTDSNKNQRESDNAPIDPPAALTDITPRVQPTLGETEKVLYKDKDNKQCYRTPAKSIWTEPVVERIPTLELKITQYESSITYEQMLERKFKVNKSTYRGQPRYDWLITQVEAVETQVQLSGGATTCAQVTYTLEHSPHLYGWKEDRVLIDSHYLDAGDRKPFSEIVDYSTGLIDNVGEQLSDQDGEPEYIQYETFADIEFSDFLQA